MNTAAIDFRVTLIRAQAERARRDFRAKMMQTSDALDRELATLANNRTAFRKMMRRANVLERNDWHATDTQRLALVDRAESLGIIAPAGADWNDAYVTLSMQYDGGR